MNHEDQAEQKRENEIRIYGEYIAGIIERYSPKIKVNKLPDNYYSPVLIVGDQKGSVEKQRYFNSIVRFKTPHFADQCAKYAKARLFTDIGYDYLDEIENWSLDKHEAAFELKFQSLCTDYKSLLNKELY